MKWLAISGSARADSTNTAMLRALAGLAPEGVEIDVFAGVAGLPVFSPDLDSAPPASVARYIAQVAEADGLIVASPEYVRALPGGLKNAVDWLVSRDTLIGKPVAIAHASHRGDDMLESLRAVLATVSDRFAPNLFLRLPLMKMTPPQIAQVLTRPEPSRQARDFLAAFARFCRAETP